MCMELGMRRKHKKERKESAMDRNVAKEGGRDRVGREANLLIFVARVEEPRQNISKKTTTTTTIARDIKRFRRPKVRILKMFR